MNANELADLLEVDSWYKLVTREEIATMLRQQQAEIERLTMLCDCMTTESNRKGNEIEELKAHPVKELTDEEIEIEWFKVFKPETGIGKNLTNGVYEFALAILRKAQE